MSCNTYSTTMGDCFVFWQDILGKPENSSSLNSFIDEKIEEAKKELLEILGEELDALAEKIAEDLKDGILDGQNEIDPYKVDYKDTTVGDALDKLFDSDLAGTIIPDIVYEKGFRSTNELISWSFNKPLKKLTIQISSDSAPTETIELNPIDTNYVVPVITDNTRITVVGTTEEDNQLTLSMKVTFKLRMFYGTHPTEDITSTQVLGLNSILIDFDDKKFVHLFNCQEKEYIYYLFPNDMHMYYNFYTNGLKDSGYLWETMKVVNQYGYTTEYIKFRTPIALTGSDIRSEVYAHEAY